MMVGAWRASGMINRLSLGLVGPFPFSFFFFFGKPCPFGLNFAVRNGQIR